MPAAVPNSIVQGAGLETLPVVPGVALVGMIAVPAFSLINLGRAWRGWREGRGTGVRLLLVCVATALLQVLPLLLFIVVFNAVGRSMQDRILPAGILVVWNWLLLTMSLGRPVRMVHSREELPLVEDQPFRERVRELASAMGLRTPVVRMVRSLSGEQQAAAFAGGLPAPSLVVTDGILHRLSPDERDAVVGHELAHLANGSLWWLTCVTPFAAIGGLLTAGAVDGWFAVLAGLSLRIGLLRMVSRWFELDCDRRAADVIGFSTMASALRKIHAVHVLRDVGWRSVLVYATTTHPSCIERLAALADAAPDGDQPDRERFLAEYRRRVLAARIAATLWVITLILSVVGRVLWPSAVWPPALLIGVLTVPFWPLIDVWGKYRRIARRTRQRRLQRVFGLTLLATAAIACVMLEQSVWVRPPDSLLIQLLIVCCALFGILQLVGGMSPGTRRIRRKLLTALQNHDFQAAAHIGTEHPRLVARNAELTHNAAVARILSGDHEGGIGELRANVERHPQFVQSLLTLSAVHLDAGDYGAACEAATQAAARLKDDPAPRVLHAAALWRLGRLDEAESQAREAMRLEPESGEPYVVLAGVLIARGDQQGAREALQTAERLAPGLPATRLVEAEAALRFEEPDAARRAIERARAAARSNPFAVIDRQVDRLEAELQDSPTLCSLTEARR